MRGDFPNHVRNTTRRRNEIDQAIQPGVRGIEYHSTVREQIAVQIMRAACLASGPAAALIHGPRPTVSQVFRSTPSTADTPREDIASFDRTTWPLYDSGIASEFHNYKVVRKQPHRTAVTVAPAAVGQLWHGRKLDVTPSRNVVSGVVPWREPRVDDRRHRLCVYPVPRIRSLRRARCCARRPV